MLALGSKQVNGTFETIERVALALERDLKALIIFVTANLARRHSDLLY
jgi:hypothetical protein